jgi:dTDP-4-amino-4,6-dideoxygalactose transaminase
LRDYGQTAKYHHELVGYNSRLDELHAGILRRALLPRLPARTARRREIAARYLANIYNPALRIPGAPSGSDSCWHLFPVFVESGDKTDFRAWMDSRGIATGEHYPLSIPDQPAMRNALHELASPIDTARRLCRTQVSLPLFPSLTNEEADRVIEACNAWKG